MHARVTTIMGPAEGAKEARTRLAEEFAPKAKEIKGLSGAYFLPRMRPAGRSLS